MKQVTVSVIMPVYNTPVFALRRAIESVVNQVGFGPPNGPYLELILVDDGSDRFDVKAELADQHLSASAKRPIKLITMPVNSGAAKARNHAVVTAAAGEYVAFLDADDQWFSSSLFARLTLARSVGYHFVWSSFIDRLQEGHAATPMSPLPMRMDMCNSKNMVPHTKQTAAHASLKHNPIAMMTVLMRRSCFLAHGGFEEGLVCSEDWLLWRRILNNPETRCAFLDEPTAYYFSYHDTTGMNQSRRLHMPKSGEGFHLDVADPAGGAGQYLDLKATQRARQWSA
jgi:glycosyltransferase involved in cell wall biosynthesis